MTGKEIIPHSSGALSQALPGIVSAEGKRAQKTFLEFFTATIRNKNTRMAYLQAIVQFDWWCREKKIERLQNVEPMVVAAYIEALGKERSVPTVKQHLAALKKLFDWFVVNHVIAVNPASSVRGPTYITTVGKTPVLEASQARQLLDSIDISEIVGVRDRALLSVMIYTFARVGAVVAMDVADYYQSGKRWWVGLHEKGGKRHAVPAHHNLEAYLDDYITAAGIAGLKKHPLFPTINRQRLLTSRRLNRTDVLRMIKRRVRDAGLPDSTCCHTFRATGITAYLENGGTIENAQAIAAHASPRTTKLYDRTGDTITLDEVERILI